MLRKKAKFYLFIDTSQFDTAKLGVFLHDKEIAKVEFKSQRRLSELMIPNLDRLFNRSRISPSDLKGIVVIIGPGSFSGLRTGTAIANALSFAFKAPLFGVKVRQGGYNIAKITRKSYKKAILRPYYGEKPNITKPKKNHNFGLFKAKRKM